MANAASQKTVQLGPRAITATGGGARVSTVVLIDPAGDGKAVEARARTLAEEGFPVELIALAGDEEYVELRDSRLCHHLPNMRGIRAELRLAGKLLELEYLWNREVLWLEGAPARLQRVLAKLRPDWLVPKIGHRGFRPAQGGKRRVETIDLVCCTYNRFDELAQVLPGFLAEAESVTKSGINCRVVVVYQNEGFAERWVEQHPEWRERKDLAFLFSDKPGLPRARNVAVQASRADQVIFIDDDQVLDPDFVLSHVRALESFPGAVGVGGRVRSRILGERGLTTRQVGQIRLSSDVAANFDSEPEGAVVVLDTPPGGNMSFDRKATTEFLGRKRWFNDELEGAAHREETSLAIEIRRRGGYFVYEPKASLLHLEAIEGGCENRQLGNPRIRVRHVAQDFAFLFDLYRGVPVLGLAAPFLRSPRAIAELHGWKKAAQLLIELEGYRRGWIQFRRRQVRR